MSKIQILDNSTITKIAAGEVIERPSSVVKELVENSIDACASQIIVKIKESGKKQISVIDNGTGMSKDDLILCTKRHATSKIKKIEDIFSILSYGFRGEALATIAEVSKMEIISGLKDSEFSHKLILENGKQVDIIPDTKYQGTTINVYNLFYNIPARQKFLKSNSYELKRIIDWLKTISIPNYKINFKLYNENNLIFDYKITNNIKERLQDVFKLNTIKAEYNDAIINSQVYYTNPTDIKEINENTKQIFYVNNRPILNKTISFAISKAFESYIPKGRKPNAFVFLDINPNIIDVNVHPQKLEIRVKDDNTFFYATYNAIKNSLDKGFQDNSERKTKIISLLSDETEKNELNNYLNNNNKKLNDILNFSNNLQNNQSKLNVDSKENLIYNNQEKDLQNNNLQKYKILGQYNNTFILIEDLNQSLLLIDQHVAEERYNFENYLNIFDNDNAIKQQALILPLNLEIDIEYLHIFSEYQDIFFTFGFDISLLKDEILVRSIPIILGRIPSKVELKEMLLDICNNIDQKEKLKTDNIINNLKVKILTSLACKNSIKADTTLSIFEMKRIVDNLFKTKNPYTCPHGRPIIIELTKKEIYHKIGRI